MLHSRGRNKRSFPGRLTLEEWLALPFSKRAKLVWRAQCELLGAFRFCAGKRCRRERTCCGGDPEACRQKLWRLTASKPKTLRREWARLDRLSELRPFPSPVPGEDTRAQRAR